MRYQYAASVCVYIYVQCTAATRNRAALSTQSRRRWRRRLRRRWGGDSTKGASLARGEQHYDAKMARWRRHPRISRATRHWPPPRWQTTPSPAERESCSVYYNNRRLHTLHTKGYIHARPAKNCPSCCCCYLSLSFSLGWFPAARTSCRSVRSRTFVSSLPISVCWRPRPKGTARCSAEVS